MAQHFLACDREQELLLPPSRSDWLAADHLAWFVLDGVDELDLGGFLAIGGMGGGARRLTRR